MNTIFILRAIPGSGKSTVADFVANLATLASKSSTICCADDYFIQKYGYYKWSAEEIGKAHVWCQTKFKYALDNGVDVIIVANTSTKAKDVNTYHKLAVAAGYIVHVMTVENWHNGNDEHNVPEATKEAMAEQLKNSIKLFPSKKAEIIAYLTKDKMRKFIKMIEPAPIAYETFCKQTNTKMEFSYFNQIFNTILI